MAVSVPAAEQFRYSVFVLAGSMLTLATVRRSPLTLDPMLDRLRSRRIRDMTPRDGYGRMIKNGLDRLAARLGPG